MNDNKVELIKLWNIGKSIKEISLELGVSESWVKKWRCKLKLRARRGGHGKTKYTVDVLAPIVSDSTSMRQVLFKLGVNVDSGGMFNYINDLIKRFNIDKSHFLGTSWNIGGKQLNGSKLCPNEYLICDPTFKRRSSSIRNWLVRDKVKEYKCEICGLSEQNNKPIPLELHHINGKKYDNSIENIKLLCPNCHAFTDNYRGKGINWVGSQEG